ncbi:MAG: hypothetical protein M3P93_04875, partial [Actinomycetota bacterium]|nr:hypothetical protein [Actinomycetota bacterium]
PAGGPDAEGLVAEGGVSTAEVPAGGPDAEGLVAEGGVSTAEVPPRGPVAEVLMAEGGMPAADPVPVADVVVPAPVAPPATQGPDHAAGGLDDGDVPVLGGQAAAPAVLQSTGTPGQHTGTGAEQQPADVSASAATSDEPVEVSTTAASEPADQGLAAVEPSPSPEPAAQAAPASGAGRPGASILRALSQLGHRAEGRPEQR